MRVESEGNARRGVAVAAFTVDTRAVRAFDPARSAGAGAIRIADFAGFVTAIRPTCDRAGSAAPSTGVALPAGTATSTHLPASFGPRQTFTIVLLVAEIDVRPAATATTGDVALTAASLPGNAPIRRAAFVSDQAFATDAGPFATIHAVPDRIIAVRAWFAAVTRAGTANLAVWNAILPESIDATLGEIVRAQRVALTGRWIARFAIGAIVVALAMEGSLADAIPAHVWQETAFATAANARNRRSTSDRRIRRATELFAIATAEATGVVTAFGIPGTAGREYALRAAIGTAFVWRRSRTGAHPVDRYLYARAPYRLWRRGWPAGSIGVVPPEHAICQHGAAKSQHSLQH